MVTTPRSGDGAHPGAADPPSTPPARLGSLLGYLREHRAVLAGTVLLSLVGAAATLAQPAVVNTMLTSVQAGGSVGGSVAWLVLLVVGGTAVGAFQQYLLERTGEGVVRSVRRRLVHRLLRLPVREYERRRTGDLVSRVGSDTTLVREALTGGLVDAVAGVVVLVGAVVAMALISPMLLGLTLTVVALAVLAVVVASRRIQTLMLQAQEAVGRLAAGTERALGAVRTVRANNATGREETRLAAETEAAWDLGVATARTSALLRPVAGLATQGAFLAVLGVGGYQVAAGRMPVADLISFVLYLFVLLMPLGQGFGAIITVRRALGALGRIDEITDLPQETDGDRPADPVPPAPPRGCALEVQDVTFGYDPAAPVLHGVGFRVPPGTTTALVGPSGSGKSTLLALVERFHDPDAGRVLLDGGDIRDLPRQELRARIAYVEQDAPVLAGTIRENLLLGAPDAGDDACRAVLAQVRLLERVEQHPEGLDRTVGDEGAGLSGGERQRLAIARALLADAPVLLLDEPTASLDSRNERALQQAIRAAAHRCTVLIVAHRLATVVGAEQIVVLEAGRVRGRGTHAELLRGDALYRELAAGQLLTAREG